MNFTVGFGYWPNLQANEPLNLVNTLNDINQPIINIYEELIGNAYRQDATAFNGILVANNIGIQANDLMLNNVEDEVVLLGKRDQRHRLKMAEQILKILQGTTNAQKKQTCQRALKTLMKQPQAALPPPKQQANKQKSLANNILKSTFKKIPEEKQILKAYKAKLNAPLSVYDENGCIRFTGEDICDCFDLNCSGCWWLCPTCQRSHKCGLSCRCNRQLLPEELANKGILCFNAGNELWEKGDDKDSVYFPFGV